MDIQKEIEFCKETDCERNEHNQFIYTSTNGKSSFNLPYILHEYKQFLTDNKIVFNKEYTQQVAEQVRQDCADNAMPEWANGQIISCDRKSILSTTIKLP